MPAARRDAHHRAQPLGVARHQRGRQDPLGHQPVRAVEIRHQRLEQIRALDQPFAQTLPFRLVDQHRHMAQRPGALVRAFGGILAEEHARIAQILVAAGEAAVEIVGREPRQMAQEAAPDRADPARRIHHLVGHAGLGPVAVGQSGQARREARLPLHQSPAGRLRSSVIGNSGCGRSGASGQRPALCPWGWKRASLRASASLPFTGKVS